MNIHENCIWTECIPCFRVVQHTSALIGCTVGNRGQHRRELPPSNTTHFKS